MVRKLFFGGLIFPFFLLKLSTYGFLWGRKLFFGAQKLSSRPSERKVCPNFPLEPAERKVLERGKEGGLEGGGEVERRSEGQ